MEEWKVADLLLSNSKNWDITKLQSFNYQDRELILQIPLSLREIVDTLFWSPDKDGIYRVKGAYQLLTNHTILDQDPASDFPWQNFWKLHIPSFVS